MLRTLFDELAAVFDGKLAIETAAREMLLSAESEYVPPADSAPLPSEVLKAMSASDAHPVCRTIASIPFVWTPPTTSLDPLYVEHSKAKVHVELIGPGGLVPSDQIRLGLYGMLPNAEYGIRTHPAEEIYVMLAGQSFWIRGDAPYIPLGPGERSHHPSMLPHASKTEQCAFMSIYVWAGDDISTDNYRYDGLPLS
ncbi:MAG: dimethylsulfonioproprionate lyase family protein [Boseongicola sp.]|nr:dimethylsulfonioproprionate lyase family protein [Boseongicola sp.]